MKNSSNTKYASALALLFALATSAAAQASPTCAHWIYEPNRMADADRVPNGPDEHGNWALICRGSFPTMTYYMNGRGESVHEVTFKRAAGGAGLRGENLHDGECAWPDRPLLADEPAKLRIYADCTPEIRYTWVGGNTTVHLSMTAAGIFSMGRANSAFFVSRETVTGDPAWVPAAGRPIYQIRR